MFDYFGPPTTVWGSDLDALSKQQPNLAPVVISAPPCDLSVKSTPVLHLSRSKWIFSSCGGAIDGSPMVMQLYSLHDTIYERYYTRSNPNAIKNRSVSSIFSCDFFVPIGTEALLGN
jgi:hypothetical protein